MIHFTFKDILTKFTLFTTIYELKHSYLSKFLTSLNFAMRFSSQVVGAKVHILALSVHINAYISKKYIPRRIVFEENSLQKCVLLVKIAYKNKMLVNFWGELLQNVVN